VRVLRFILSFAVIVSTAAAVVLPVSAATYGGGSVSGYASDAALDNGTITLLTGKDANSVKIATKSEVQNMFGVTVDKSQLPVVLSDASLKNEVFVAVSGTYNVLVSNQNGPISAGDYVTLSSINGIAMNASTDKTTVFGRANESFDGKGLTLGTSELKASDGTVKKVVLGSVPVTIDIRSNPNDQSTKVKAPEFLERIGKAIAEKEVSPIRIYLSMAITAVSIIAAIVIIYSGVRNGVISIGRNPMSKKSIFRALFEIILTSILILIIGLFAVYLLLKL